MNKSERLKEFWRQVKSGERPAPQRGKGDGTIKRVVRCNSNWARSGEVILIVYPHGELGFREPRRRAEYRLGLPEALRVAVTLTTNKIAARVRELKREGMSIGAARRKARKELL